jgi:hypothetical protein
MYVEDLEEIGVVHLFTTVGRPLPAPRTRPQVVFSMK